MKQFVGIFGTMFKVFIATALLVPALATSAMAGDTQRLHYTIRDLGTLGGIESYGYGINNRGQVTGQASTAGGAVHAFIYRPRRGMKDLGTLPGGTWSSGSAINDHGQVTGSAGGVNNVGQYAFIYSAWSGMQDLGTPPDYYTNEIWANSINTFGQVTGEYSLGYDAAYQAFVYSESAGMQDLGIIGTNFSQGQGINDSGQIAGVYYANVGEILQLPRFHLQSGNGHARSRDPRRPQLQLERWHGNQQLRTAHGMVQYRYLRQSRPCARFPLWRVDGNGRSRDPRRH